MSNEKQYNGYTNYETWNCALWLDNEPCTQEAMSEKATELVEAMEDVNDEDELRGTVSLMADFISDLVEEINDSLTLPTTGMCADLLSAALREIDYYDIAQSQLADAVATRKEAEKVTA